MLKKQILKLRNTLQKLEEIRQTCFIRNEIENETELLLIIKQGVRLLSNEYTLYCKKYPKDDFFGEFQKGGDN